jgi:HrpA-like RNA helicase
LTTKDVEQPVNKGRANSNHYGTDERKRKFRVASPGRREVAQYTHSYSTANVEVIKSDPPFLRSLSNNVISPRIPTKLNIFRDQNSHMARVAKARMQNATSTPFYFTEAGFGSSWAKPAELHTIFERLGLSSSTAAKPLSPVDYRKRSKMSIKQQRESLPIFNFREEIIKAVTDNPVLIVIAETGSGNYRH